MNSNENSGENSGENSDKAIKTAVQRHGAGDLAGAEKIYRQVLERQPNHAEALHLLGVALGQRGQTDAGIEVIRRAIGVKPDFVEAIRNLGAMQLQQERFDEAFASFSKAAELMPNHPQAHFDLGNALWGLERVDEAIAEYRKAIALDAKFAAAYVLLGDCLKAKDQIDEALAAQFRAAELKPDAWEIHIRVGNLLATKGRLDEAITAFSTAIRLKADCAAGHLGMARAYRAGRQLEKSLLAYRQAAQADPESVEAHAGMAKALADLQRCDEARMCHARLAKLRPNDSVTHEVLGRIILHQHGAAAAIEHLRRAVAVDSGSETGWDALGLALRSLGEFEEAAMCFRRAMELRPDLAGTLHKNLVAINREGSATEIEPLITFLAQPDLSIDQRIAGEFGVGTALDDAERYDEAFRHYAAGNSLAKRQRSSVGEYYDPGEFHASVSRIIESSTPQLFEEKRGWGDQSNIPVFVVGMPRSGTTLVHQIASSHPQVHGAGELKDISYILNILLSADGAVGRDRDALEKAARQHLERLASLNAAASRIVDKQPSNLLFLGIIALMFPRARVIFCRRDPRDTCLSCFFQPFAAGNTFSFDLAHCGHHHLENDRLRAHWLRVLPLSMLEVQYEEVCNDLEGQSRRLIDFLGLPWDPACLEFHRAQSTVLTASVWQVRQPIYQRSVGRWKHYERHLGPLFEALGMTNEETEAKGRPG